MRQSFFEGSFLAVWLLGCKMHGLWNNHTDDLKGLYSNSLIPGLNEVYLQEWKFGRIFSKGVENFGTHFFISSCYRVAPSAIWEIFSEFLIFCNLFHKPSGEWNNSKIWETRKTFANIARDNVNYKFKCLYIPLSFPAFHIRLTFAG